MIARLTTQTGIIFVDATEVVVQYGDDSKETVDLIVVSYGSDDPHVFSSTKEGDVTVEINGEKFDLKGQKDGTYAESSKECCPESIFDLLGEMFNRPEDMVQS